MLRSEARGSVKGKRTDKYNVTLARPVRVGNRVSTTAVLRGSKDRCRDTLGLCAGGRP
ncbi:hypothetical protein PCAR4_180027 [Paraburkholderia caribensis]|nr:hypothetical protein PCAR4_180027 [Paraburkholderia caribensis]